jgi:hypothetical protein
VALAIPRVGWTTAASALKACADAMPKGSPLHPEVLKFTQENMYNILDIMVALHSVDNSPRSFSGLQGLWQDETFDEFSKCFLHGISNACR